MPRYIQFFTELLLLKGCQTHSPVLVKLTELVFTLNFSFDGDYYQQISGVAMGTKMGPNYTSLFVGFVEKQIIEQYTGPLPDTLVGTLMTVLVQHHVFMSSWSSSLTLLMSSILHPNSHVRSVRPVYQS